MFAAVAGTVGLANAADLKTITVGYNSWIGYVAYFIANDQGYFKDAGLDVESKTFSSPGDSLSPLLTGDLDIALSTADSVITVLDKAPGQLKVVYLVDTSSGADAVLAKNGIDGIKGLKGKKVAATIGQCNQLLLEKALEQAGMSDADINLINMNPDDAGAAFAEGKLDAAVTWEPWITKALSANTGNVIFSSKDLPNLILDVAATSTKAASTKGPEIRAFLKAMGRGYDFIKSNPQKAAAIAAKALEEKPEDVTGMLPKVTLYNLEENERILFAPGQPDVIAPSKLIAQFFKDRKVNDTLVDVTGIYDGEFLK